MRQQRKKERGRRRAVVGAPSSCSCSPLCKRMQDSLPPSKCAGETDTKMENVISLVCYLCWCYFIYTKIFFFLRHYFQGFFPPPHSSSEQDIFNWRRMCKFHAPTPPCILCLLQVTEGFSAMILFSI